jgi:hypothetical protein
MLSTDEMDRGSVGCQLFKRTVLVRKRMTLDRI